MKLGKFPNLPEKIAALQNILSLTFDEATHTYFDMQGTPIPSLHDILAAGGYKWWMDETAMKRGSAVHKALFLADADLLDEPAMDPQIIPYLTAWRDMLEKEKMTVDLAEERMMHPTFRYGTTIDRLVTMPDGKTALLEIKTGAENWMTELQLAGQALVLGEAGIIPDRRLGWYCDAHGDDVLIDYTNSAARTVFLGLLAWDGWKKKRNIVEREVVYGGF